MLVRSCAPLGFEELMQDRAGNGMCMLRVMSDGRDIDNGVIQPSEYATTIPDISG